MEGNASVYQVYPVSRITGEGRAWGAGFEQERACWGGGGLNLCVDTIHLQGDTSDGFGRKAPVCHVCISCNVQPVRSGRSVQGGGGARRLGQEGLLQL